MALVRPTTTIQMTLLFVLVLVAAATISFTRLLQNDSAGPNVNEDDVAADQRRSLIERSPLDIQMENIEKGMKIDALEREQRWGDLELGRS